MAFVQRCQKLDSEHVYFGTREGGLYERETILNQPPHSLPPAQWRRPPGVAPGTWEYVHQRAIADHYDAFVADAPLCRADAELLMTALPGRLPTEDDQRAAEIVLDLGCGTGRAALPLAARGYDVLAVDLSLPMLQVLGEKARRQAWNEAAKRTQDAVVQLAESSPRLGQIHLLQANLVQLDCLAADSADHAICLFATLGMIQGRSHRRQVLRHVSRIVRPGGRLVIHVHNRWAAIRERNGIAALARSWFRSIGRATDEFGDTTYGYRGLQQMFMHRFSRRELQQDLQASGWRLRRLHRLTIEGNPAVSRFTIGAGFIAECESS